ncbi:NAD-dependent succinate-semialdehyde dehydrogenase [Rhodococcus sp. NPDC058521]|uniref:NAD-dependent succinate-semialdehyde dehydrogenase n=1 Tax=Rhodococcus sp. NPDC058521 TaxID=3346536 RepID=UPI00366780B4
MKLSPDSVAAESDTEKVRILLDVAGGTYATDASVGLKDTPAPLFRLLVLSLLLSARISANIAVAASKELRRSGITSMRAARAANRVDIIDALGRAHYVRYDERTATQLRDNADRMKSGYQDDLRRLAERAEYRVDNAKRLLTEFDGIGPVGADIFLREVQEVWPWVRPYFDKRARRSAKSRVTASRRHTRRPGSQRRPCATRRGSRPSINRQCRPRAPRSRIFWAYEQFWTYKQEDYTMTSTSAQPMSGTGPDAEPFESVNPYSGETVAEFPYLELEQLDAVVERAHDAFETWREVPIDERAGVVLRAAQLLRDRKDEFARLITREMGKLIAESRFEVDLAASILEYYGENGPQFLAPTEIDVEKGTARVVNQPLGVLLGIEPWNFPLYQVVRVAGPNIVAGNTILLKHAKLCAATAAQLETLFHDAGVPEGVYTNIFMRTRDTERVVKHPAVQGVALTGSEGAGSSVAALAGKHLKKCILELGGSDPFVVLDDADVSAAVDAGVPGRMANTGQSCIAAKRFFVPDAMFEQFVSEISDRLGALQPGDPLDPETTLGPLSSEQAAQGLIDQVQDAVDKGATVITGGGRPQNRGPNGVGAFVDATVLTGVTPEMRAFSEELFGPVAVVYRVSDVDEAVSMANSSVYGLGATVIARDESRAQEVANRIESGMVWINQPTGTDPRLPFGGVKNSGFGRELSNLGILEFVNRKLIRSSPA